MLKRSPTAINGGLCAPLVPTKVVTGTCSVGPPDRSAPQIPYAMTPCARHRRAAHFGSFPPKSCSHRYAPEGAEAAGGRLRRSPERVTISSDRDLPLLALLRDNTCLSQPQIHGLAPFKGLAENPKNLNRRLRKLAKAGLVTVSNPCPPFSGAIFAASSSSLLTLENDGQYLTSVSSKTENLTVPGQNLHARTLAKLQLAFYGCELLRPIAWHPDRVVKARSIPLRFYKKDWDATYVFDNKPSKSQLKVAIEYEKSHKNSARFERIADLISSETEVDLVLYFYDSPELAREMVTRFRPVGPRVAALSVAEFCKNTPRWATQTFVCPSGTGQGYRCELYDLLCFCHDVPNFHLVQHLWDSHVKSGEFVPI